MSILTLTRKLIAPVAFINAVGGFQRKSSLLKIKMAKAYVLGVQKTRILALGVLAGLLASMFLASGLFLIHTALFTYSLWSLQVKFTIALSLGCLEFFAALGLLYYLSREETWSRFCNITEVVNSAVKDRAKKPRSEP